MEAVTITQINPPEFETLLERIIDNSIKRILSVQITQPVPDVLFDIKEAGKFVKLSAPSLYKLCSENNIPHIRRGGKIMFSKDELLAWAKEGRRKTKNEIEEDAERYLGKLGEIKAVTSKNNAK